MPLPDELRKGLDSPVADIANIGSDRYGGHARRPALFLQGVRRPRACTWAHLDIAGPAWNKGAPYGYISRGGTGAATRTLIQIAEDVADGTL